jgi:hypothetical protein
MTITSGKHLKPVYCGYKGGFAGITICKDCGNTGLYEDQHTVDPCNNCGGQPIENFCGKFNSAKWEGIKVFKEGDMRLFYKGCTNELIELSNSCGPSTINKSLNKEKQGESAQAGNKGVVAKFFPMFF